MYNALNNDVNKDCNNIIKLWENAATKEQPKRYTYESRDSDAWIWKLSNGAWHREDGPAYEDANGNKEWWVDSALHRTDGPAIMKADGENMWYVDDIQYDDITAWAKAALEYENKPATQDAIDAKVAAVMRMDLFN
jgi:hypothetical protein